MTAPSSPHLETVKGLSAQIADLEGQLETARQEAAEARSAMGTVLYHVTGGRSRRWTIPQETRLAAVARVTALEWNLEEDGETLRVVIETATKGEPHAGHK